MLQDARGPPGRRPGNRGAGANNVNNNEPRNDGGGIIVGNRTAIARNVNDIEPRNDGGGIIVGNRTAGANNVNDNELGNDGGGMIVGNRTAIARNGISVRAGRPTSIPVDENDVDVKALHRAVMAGNLEKVRYCLETKGVDVESRLVVAKRYRYDAQETILLKACRKGNLKMVRYLIEVAGANINATSTSQSTSLRLAAKYEHFDVAQYILEREDGTKLLAAKDNMLRTALHAAVDRDSVEIARLLTKAAGVSAFELVHSHDKCQRTALHFATSAAMVQLLVEVGGHTLILDRDEDQDTTLHSITELDAVRRLLDLCDEADSTPCTHTGTSIHTAVAEMTQSKEVAVDYLQVGEGRRWRTELIMAQNKSGRTALHNAAEYGDYELAKLLVEEGGMALLMAVDEHRGTALHTIAQEYASDDNEFHHNVAKYLLSVGGDELLYATNSNGDCALHYYGCFCNTDMIEHMVHERNMNIDFPNGDNETVLQVEIKAVMEYGGNGIVEFLVVSCRANVNLLFDDGRTALHMVCSPKQEYKTKNGPPDCLMLARLLVETGGANVNAVDNRNRTALYCACRYGNDKLVQYLVQNAAADIQVPDDKGRTVLHYTCSMRKADALVKTRLLVQANGGNNLVHATDNCGRTPLHCVCENGNYTTAKFLVRNTAVNIDALDNTGRSSLHYACSKRKADTLGKVRLLVEAGVNTNATDVNGRTALHEAASTGQKVAVILLLLALFEPI